MWDRVVHNLFREPNIKVSPILSSNWFAGAPRV